MHLSHVPQDLEFGFIPKLNWAVVEAIDVTRDGRVYTFHQRRHLPLRHADRLIIEINRHHSTRLWEMHDIAILPRPPRRSSISIQHPLSKIGVPFATVDPKKIVGIMKHDEPHGVAGFDEPDDVSEKIAGHVVRFLADELHAGRIPADFLPLQSGVGNVANAVMAGLGKSHDIPPFYMYSEAFQDALLDLMIAGRCSALPPRVSRSASNRSSVPAPI